MSKAWVKTEGQWAGAPGQPPPRGSRAMSTTCVSGRRSFSRCSVFSTLGAGGGAATHQAFVGVESRRSRGYFARMRLVPGSTCSTILCGASPCKPCSHSSGTPTAVPVPGKGSLRRGAGNPPQRHARHCLHDCRLGGVHIRRLPCSRPQVISTNQHHRHARLHAGEGTGRRQPARPWEVPRAGMQDRRPAQAAEQSCEL